MRLDSIGMFATIKAAMSFNAERARTLAVNVVNADTPGFTPSDLGDFTDAMRTRTTRPAAVRPAQTHAAHIAPARAEAAAWTASHSPDSETTLDGNSVVVEEQMAKVAETRMAYEAALGIYQKSLNLLRTAAKSPVR